MAVGRINGVAALTGFYYKKNVWAFLPGQNKVAVITRWPY